MLTACNTAGDGSFDLLTMFKGGTVTREKPDIISRNIVNYKSSGQYELAYATIKDWATSDNNFRLLFADENVTISSLEILAYENDQYLFGKVLEKTSLDNERVTAFRNVSMDFDAVHRYYVCYFRASPPDITPCRSEVRKLQQLDPPRKHLWIKSKGADQSISGY